MKRIAIIGLLAVFLTTNYAYATLTAKELTQTMEKAQHGELTQEKAEEFLITIINSIHPEVLGGIETNQEDICLMSGVIVLALAYYAIFFGGGVELLAAVSFLVWDIVCIPLL